MKGAYKVLFYLKISISLLEKMLEKRDNYRNSPFTFKDETKPKEKRKDFIIIVAISPESKKERNALYQLEYLFSYLDKQNFSIKENVYEKVTLNTSQMLSLLFDTKPEDINESIGKIKIQILLAILLFLKI